MRSVHITPRPPRGPALDRPIDPEPIREPEASIESTASHLLTADDVAKRLGVPRSWVYAQARQNRIPFVPLGHYRRFRPEAIDSWIRDIESGHDGMTSGR
jgi:excisionase family DNA binding protein